MEGGRAAGLKPGSGSPPKEARRGRPVLPRSVVWRGLRGGAAGAAGSMSSLRRPPIEFLFVSLFILFLFLLEFATVNLRFIGLVTQGHRSIGLEEGARRARRRRKRWRQALTPLSCGAMPPTEGSAQPSTTLGGVVIPARLRLKKTLRSLITSLKCGGTLFRHTKASQGWWVGVFLSVEGRPRARLCRLYWRLRCLLADAHNHTRNIPRGLLIL